MRVVPSSAVPAQPVGEEGAANATVRWLISRPEGAPNFAMRLFELAPGGHTPLHTHPWEHEVFVLGGRLEVIGDEGPRAAVAGDALLVLPNERHQFRNPAEEPARFLCLIPLPQD